MQKLVNKICSTLILLLLASQVNAGGKLPVTSDNNTSVKDCTYYRYQLSLAKANVDDDATIRKI